MDVKASRRFTDQRERSFFNPINGQAGGGVGGGWPTNKVVCVYVLEGRCNRNPCRFAHTESPPLPISNPKLAKKSPPGYSRLKNNVWVSRWSEDRILHVRNRENPGYTGPKNSSSASSTLSDESGDKSTSNRTTLNNVCRHWLLGNCVRGDECRFLHSWFCGEGLTMLAKLEGHEKALLGIWNFFCFLIVICSSIIHHWLMTFDLSLTGCKWNCSSFKVWQAFFRQQGWNSMTLGL